MYTLRQKIRLWAIYSRSLILVIQVSRYRTVTQYIKVNGLSRCDKCKTGVGTNGYLGIRLSSFYVIKLVFPYLFHTQPSRFGTKIIISLD